MHAYLLLTPFLLFIQSAHSVMSLDKMILYFDPGKSSPQEVTVTNPDEEPLFLQTDVFRVIDPGTENEKTEKAANPEQIKLLTAPKKATLSPRTRKRIRLISLETPKKTEMVYRVSFKPVIGELQAKKSGIKVLVAYEALVFVRPEKPFYKVTAKREKDAMVFTNEGNMNVMLRNGQYCKNERKSSCEKLSVENRIYAGQSWKMPLSEEVLKAGDKGYITFGLFDGEDEKSEKFPLKPSGKGENIRANWHQPLLQPHQYTIRDGGFSGHWSEFLP